MPSRREFLKISGASIGALGTLLVPYWREHAQAVARATSNGAVATSNRQDPSASPKPLGPVKGADGRPLVYDLDVGSIESVGPLVATLRNGAGGRLLRVQPDATVWFEGEEEAYQDGMVLAGDWVEASGETLDDMSLATKRLTINSLGNLLGVAYRVEGNDLQIFPRAGRERGAYSPEVMAVHTLGSTKFYKGRGNFGNPNASLADLQAGGSIWCTGFVTRRGERNALEVIYGNQLPPDDVPDWLLQRVAVP